MENLKIVIIAEAFLIRKALADLLIEEYSHIEIIKEVKELDLFMPLIDTSYHYILIVDSGLVKKIERLYQELSNNLIIIPIVESKKGKDINSKYKEITIFDERKSILELVQRAVSYLSSINHSIGKHKELTEREKLVLQLVAKGCSSKAIAEKLFISVQTVSVHRKNITQKLGIKTLSGLTLYAVINQLIKLEETSLK